MLKIRSQSLGLGPESHAGYRGDSLRAGKTSTAVLIVVVILLALPFLLISMAFLSYRAVANANAAERARAEAVAEQQRVRAEQARLRAEAQQGENGGAELSSRPLLAESGPEEDAAFSPPKPMPDTIFRPVTRPVYEQRVNPDTGQVETVQRFVTEYVRAEPDAPIQNPRASNQDPTSRRLAAELRQATESEAPQDAEYERKLQELRTRLGLEFDQMHEAQAKLIAETEKRLDSLKDLHQQRAEKKDKIVQRRINELLGKVDALQWEVPPIFLNGTAYRDPAYQVIPPDGNGGTFPAVPQSPSFQPALRLQMSPPNITRPKKLPGTSGSSTTEVGPKPVETATASTADAFQPTTDEAVSPSTGTEPPTDESPAEDLPSGDDVEPATDALQSSLQIDKLFEVARRFSAAQTGLAIAESKLEATSLLRDSGRSPQSEVDMAAANLAQVQRELALSQMEIRAFGQTATRRLTFAQQRLSIAKQRLQLAQEKYKQGLIPQEQVTSAQIEKNAAEASLQDALSMVDYYQRTENWLKQQTADPNASEAASQADELLGPEQSSSSQDAQDLQDPFSE